MISNRAHIWKYINIKQNFMATKIPNSSLLTLLEIASLRSRMWETDLVFLHKDGLYSLEWNFGGSVFSLIWSKTTDKEIVHCTDCVLTSNLSLKDYVWKHNKYRLKDPSKRCGWGKEQSLQDSTYFKMISLYRVILV